MRLENNDYGGIAKGAMNIVITSGAITITPSGALTYATPNYLTTVTPVSGIEPASGLSGTAVWSMLSTPTSGTQKVLCSRMSVLSDVALQIDYYADMVGATNGQTGTTTYQNNSNVHLGYETFASGVRRDINLNFDRIMLTCDAIGSGQTVSLRIYR